MGRYGIGFPLTHETMTNRSSSPLLQNKRPILRHALSGNQDKSPVSNLLSSNPASHSKLVTVKCAKIPAGGSHVIHTNDKRIYFSPVGFAHQRLSGGGGAIHRIPPVSRSAGVEACFIRRARCLWHLGRLSRSQRPRLLRRDASTEYRAEARWLINQRACWTRLSLWTTCAGMKLAKSG